MEATTDRTSLAMLAMDPEAVITSSNQPHIVLGENGFVGCLRGQPKPGLSLVSKLLQLLLQPDQVVYRAQSWILAERLNPDWRS